MRKTGTPEERDLLIELAFNRRAAIPWERVDELAAILPALLQRTKVVHLKLTDDQRDGSFIDIAVGNPQLTT